MTGRVPTKIGGGVCLWQSCPAGLWVPTSLRSDFRPAALTVLKVLAYWSGVFRLCGVDPCWGRREAPCVFGTPPPLTQVTQAAKS